MHFVQFYALSFHGIFYFYALLHLYFLSRSEVEFSGRLASFLNPTGEMKPVKSRLIDLARNHVQSRMESEKVENDIKNEEEMLAQKLEGLMNILIKVGEDVK